MMDFRFSAMGLFAVLFGCDDRNVYHTPFPLPAPEPSIVSMGGTDVQLCAVDGRQYDRKMIDPDFGFAFDVLDAKDVPAVRAAIRGAGYIEKKVGRSESVVPIPSQPCGFDTAAEGIDGWQYTQAEKARYFTPRVTVYAKNDLIVFINQDFLAGGPE